MAPEAEIDKDEGAAIKGIPEFWLCTMKNQDEDGREYNTPYKMYRKQKNTWYASLSDNLMWCLVRHDAADFDFRTR